MGVKVQFEELWPTRVGFYSSQDFSRENEQLYLEALAASADRGRVRTASERRVRDILDRTEHGERIKAHLLACARHFVGEFGHLIDPDYCENRALVMGKGSFINTHKDSREGDITCVYFLTGGPVDQPINSVGNPRFVVEDPSRYFDEGRLPYESRHSYSVAPHPGLAVFFPSHIPHNQHPYTGDKTHVQIVANFRVNMPTELEEELFD